MRNTWMTMAATNSQARPANASRAYRVMLRSSSRWTIVRQAIDVWATAARSRYRLRPGGGSPNRRRLPRIRSARRARPAGIRAPPAARGTRRRPPRPPAAARTRRIARRRRWPAPGPRRRARVRRAAGGPVPRPDRRRMPWTNRARRRRLEVAALGLLAFDGLEQRLEVAHAEAARPVPLDDLEEEGGPILHGPGEDLEEVALLVAIGLDAQLLEGGDRDAHVADAVGQRRVVLVRQSEELDAVVTELANGPHDVLRPEGDVLGPRVQVPVEEFLDLALLLAGRGLVDGELDPPVAVGHDLRHQGAVLGMDHLVVVVDQLAEAEHVAVIGDVLVHLAQPDVADAVVDLEEAQALGRPARFLDPAVAGGEDAVVVAPVHERVTDVAVRPNGRATEDAVIAPIEIRRFHRRGRASRRRLAKRGARVVHGKGDIADAVSMATDVLGDLAVRRERCREHERDVVPAHHVARPVANPRLETGKGNRRESPQRAVVGGCLAGVANPELDVVDALE